MSTNINQNFLTFQNGRTKGRIDTFQNCISYIACLYIFIALSFQGEMLITIRYLVKYKRVIVQVTETAYN